MSGVIDRKHAGPAAAVCAECGEEIGAYESRRYGNDGAVHVWMPGEIATRSKCLSAANKHKYPNWYTDG